MMKAVTAQKQPWLNNQEMSDRVFFRFAELIYEKCGIKMPPVKKTMLTARLTKRLRCLKMTSFDEYYDYVCGPAGQAEELVHMIDVVTTNKTDFFREPGHFDYLMSTALPKILQVRDVTDLNKLRVWSAGCSTGEEPYTAAMFLSEFFRKIQGDFQILATDISSRVLDKAASAVYSADTVKPIPETFKRSYLLRGKGSQTGFFRIVPELRKKVMFQRLNLLEGRNFGIRGQMDIIFCRNVIIYFDRDTQISLFRKFYAQLRPGGYMFVGHSETLNSINNDFKPVANAVYRKPNRGAESAR